MLATRDGSLPGYDQSMRMRRTSAANRIRRNQRTRILAIATFLAALTALPLAASALLSPQTTQTSIDYTPAPVPPRVMDPTVVFIGDSFTGGSDMGGYGTENWSAVASELLGWRNCTFGVGGSGWTQGANGWTFKARVDWALERRPALVVFANGINDVKGDALKIGQAADDTLRYLRKKDPDVPVVVIGPISFQDFPALHVMNEGVRKAAISNGATYLDAIELQWFTGNATRFIGEDGFHPTTAGHEYLAKEFTEEALALGLHFPDVPEPKTAGCSTPDPSLVDPDGNSVTDDS